MHHDSTLLFPRSGLTLSLTLTTPLPGLALGIGLDVYLSLDLDMDLDCTTHPFWEMGSATWMPVKDIRAGLEMAREYLL